MVKVKNIDNNTYKRIAFVVIPYYGSIYNINNQLTFLVCHMILLLSDADGEKTVTWFSEFQRHSSRPNLLHPFILELLGVFHCTQIWL